ncbi:helix-turn-helix transcriptional regulator [Telluribacter sp.]|jgi:transcriptional regulator with XRE-family HTH domain|uniref:helix-turn-helix domain-containing protein n=1 Tax=Telluribacter sp. TaxID=1978767 RepID=UPI002E10BA2A|nr:helix-turn-helix transcriptional regulator [Telluribacter sp.]
MQIGSRLRQLRYQHKASTREIADQAGVSQSTYMDWEQDKTSPTLSNFEKLAKAFQLCPTELMKYLVEQ